MSHFPSAFLVQPIGQADELNMEFYDEDPRGLLWMWETYDPRFEYVMAIDPTVGTTGWNRVMKSEQDRNNGCIQIIRQGKGVIPDLQVAEYAAPVDPFDLGKMAAFMGSLYTSKDGDQPLCIVENTGPGFAVVEKLHTLNYENMWHWEYYGDTVGKQTKSIGWHASTRTNLDLWVRGSRVIKLKSLIVRSEWLSEEMSDARIGEHLYAEVGDGSGIGHGDRLRAILLGIWASNRFTIDQAFEESLKPISSEPKNWAAMAMSYEEIMEEWDDHVSRMSQ